MFLDVHTRSGTPHIKTCSDVNNRVETSLMKMCVNIHTELGTLDITDNMVL